MSLTPKQQRALSLHIEAIIIGIACICFLLFFIGTVSEPVAVIVACCMITFILALMAALVVGIIRKHWE